MGDLHDLPTGLAEELFSGRGDRDILPFNLNLRHSIDDYRHTGRGVDFRELFIQGQELQGEEFGLFEYRPDECSPALHDAVADGLRGAIRPEHPSSPTRNHQYLVGAYLRVAAGIHQDKDTKHDHDTDSCHDHHAHRLPSHYRIPGPASAERAPLTRSAPSTRSRNRSSSDFLTQKT